MKAVVFGAAGIIGQHLRLLKPDFVDAIYTRTQADALHVGIDLTDRDARESFLNEHQHDAIINLAGENRPDVVERNPSRYLGINVEVPAALSWWATNHDAHYVHVSSQAVFGGELPKGVPDSPTSRPPYGVDSLRIPVNAYGIQKLHAEQEVKSAGHTWTIVRPTFVCGIRPMPAVGRENPIEQMLSPAKISVEGEVPAIQRHVANRWFSVAFARDVAEELWRCVCTGPRRTTIHVGIPYGVSRYDVAAYLNPSVESIMHEDLPGLAQRPMDTTYAGEGTWEQVRDGLHKLACEYDSREKMDINQRAKEIAIFIGISEAEALAKLQRGFGRLHNEVTQDFRRANPQTDDELLEWYRNTTAYIWELSAYHLDPGFNYSGMCAGIAEALKAKGANRVLCLGDGIGDLTLTLSRSGFDAIYHDLKGSRTADFASHRFAMYLARDLDVRPSQMPASNARDGWSPDWMLEWAAWRGPIDAIVSLDFLEHVTCVEDWVRAIYAALKPGGWLVAQNGFAMGSGPDGAMPMHLERNDRYEFDWDPLLAQVGFVQERSNWYKKPL